MTPISDRWDPGIAAKTNDKYGLIDCPVSACSEEQPLSRRRSARVARTLATHVEHILCHSSPEQSAILVEKRFTLGFQGVKRNFKKTRDRRHHPQSAIFSAYIHYQHPAVTII